MTPVRVSEAVSLRIDEIYRYSRERWGEAPADACVPGLFEAFKGIATGAVASRPVPAELGVDGYVFRYRSEKAADEAGWRHVRILLEPGNPEYAPTELVAEDEGSVAVVAELVEVMGVETPA